jgi:hypothetical protein
MLSKNDSQVIGYSHLTNPAKNAGQVIGYHELPVLTRPAGCFTFEI